MFGSAIDFRRAIGRFPPLPRRKSRKPSKRFAAFGPPIIRRWPRHLGDLLPPAVGAPTRRGDLVLDCLVVEPDLWWVGFHRAAGMPSGWPGGLYPDSLPADAVSRAYLKLEEARLVAAADQAERSVRGAWQRPGGAAQALLRHGARVIGIDPADMDPRVLADPNFEHWKKRSADVRRREFRDVRGSWPI